MRKRARVEIQAKQNQRNNSIKCPWKELPGERRIRMVFGRTVSDHS